MTITRIIGRRPMLALVKPIGTAIVLASIAVFLFGAHIVANAPAVS